jgi:hypothetical protein
VQSTPITTFRSLTPAYGTSLGITRIIPVHTITEDLAWTKGAHDVRFGGVIRRINNRSLNFANSFSSASTNSSWLQGVGSDITPAALGVQSGFLTSYRDGMMALLGIVSQVMRATTIEPTARPDGRRAGRTEIRQRSTKPTSRIPGRSAAP